MEPDSLALLGLGLGVMVILGTAVARRTGLPDPVVLVAVGLVASFVPGSPTLELPPEVVFLVFLPPLVFRASFLTSPRTLRRNATPLALLAVGLVLATAVVVALVVSAVVPGIGFSEGLVLGAIVAPTDPVAASGIFSRLGAPRGVVDLVESESLINDATALVLYAIAVEAVLSGPPSALSALAQLALSVAGGAGVGAVAYLLVVVARHRVSDIGLQLLLSLVTPYAAYIVADRIEASGVLAVVTVGVLLGGRPGGVFGSSARLQASAFWELLDLLLNAVLFVLLGLQVRTVLDAAPHLAAGELVLYPLLTTVTVVLMRMAWQSLVPPLVYSARRAAGRPVGGLPMRERLLVGWVGMRGAVSLAAALALPLEADGRPFPGRALLLFLTVAVVLGTLVVQGTSLPLVLQRSGMAEDPESGRHERHARLALAEVALARLDELEQAGEISPGGALPLRQVWEQARTRLTASADGMEAPEVDLVDLRLDLARTQGAELDRLEREDEISPEVVRELRREIDLQRVRLGAAEED